MKNGIVIIASLIFIFGHVVNIRADEISELKQQLAEQAKLIEQMQNRLEQLEKSQKTQEQNVDVKISEAVEKKQIQALPEKFKWIENIKLSGDFRYRHESIDSQADGEWRKGQTRHRIRARLGLDAKVNDDWDASFRLATGCSDPASTNQTLENSFSGKDIWLDLAYLTWHPAAVKGLNVYGGKMKNPFYSACKNTLIWDDDVNPEGIAASYEIPFGEVDKLYVNGGGFWVDESASGADTSLFGVQSYLKHTFENKNYLIGGLSYYNYGNIQGRGDLKSTWSTSSSFFGNTKTAANTFASDYDIFEAFGEYGFSIADRPVSVYGSFVKNLSSATSKDTGWLVGCTFNKAKDPGSWELSYDYRVLEADAVLGAFSDSDFIGGGTDGKGHTFSFKYQLAKNLQSCLKYFLNEVGSENDAYRRFQADIVFKF